MKPEEYTVTINTNIVCYRLRHPSGMYWADITIDAAEGAEEGRIFIASDFGSWQRYWSHCGEPFRKALMGMGIDYVAGKFGEDEYLMFDETMKWYRENILQARKEERLTAKESRLMFDELKDVEEVSCDDLKDFKYYMYYNCPALMKYYNYDVHAITGTSPRFKKFWESCWKVLMEEFRKEAIVENLVNPK